MKWSVGTKISLGYASAVLMLIIIGIVSYTSLTRSLDDAEWVSHTYEVLAKMEDIISLVKDVESGQRGYVITLDENYLVYYKKAIDSIDARIDELRRLTSDNSIQQGNINDLKGLIKQKLDYATNLVEKRKTLSLDQVKDIMLTEQGISLMRSIRDKVDQMKSEETRLLGLRNEVSRRSTVISTASILGGCALSAILLAVAAFFITRNITVPLGQLTEVAGKISDGDIVLGLVNSKRTDEVGILENTFIRMTQSLKSSAHIAETISKGDLTVAVKPLSDRDVMGNALNTMVSNLRESTNELREGINVLAAAISEILSSVSQIVSGATETATSVTETATTIEEMKQTATMAGHRAKNVADMAQRSVQISQVGNSAVQDTIQAMNQVRDQIATMAQSVVRLSEQSQTIGEIIATVNDLAEQSNILAINAAIEAARAGEQGRSFAIVAQEVKNLADQSKAATSQVRNILSEIQKATSQAVMATEKGSKVVEESVKQSLGAGDSIQLLAKNITEASQAVAQISISTQEQIVGVDQVSIAVGNIKEASSQNVMVMRQVEVAARNLHDLSQKLKGLAEHYRI